MENSKLYTKVNFKAPVMSLVSTYIREYDLSKANINVLYLAGVIGKDQYLYLMTAPRMERQIKIGILLKGNKTAQKLLADGIIEAKRKLFEANNIQDEEVLMIKNDAVFIVGRQLQHTQFEDGYINFKAKEVYTSFYRLDNLELLYYSDKINNVEDLVIKGMGDRQFAYHNDHMIELLKYIFSLMEANDAKGAMESLTYMYDQYMKMSLETNFYRPFDESSLFKVERRNNQAFLLENIEPSMLPYIDKERNRYLLSQLVILISIYI